jgi:hypothetical protein
MQRNSCSLAEINEESEMRVPFLLAATLSLAAGCATNVPNAMDAQRSATGTYYCSENKLVDSGGRLVCNWNADPRAACEEDFPSYIERSSVKSEPQHAHRCANGHDLAVVTTR